MLVSIPRHLLPYYVAQSHKRGISSTVEVQAVIVHSSGVVVSVDDVVVVAGIIESAIRV